MSERIMNAMLLATPVFFITPASQANALDTRHPPGPTDAEQIKFLVFLRETVRRFMAAGSVTICLSQRQSG